MAKWKPTTFVVPLPVRQGIHFARVPGWPDYAATDDGYIWSSKIGSWRQMIGKIDKAGRPVVTLRHQGKQKSPVVAVLILAAFRGSPPSGTECCHNDGNPANNQLGNLRWDTRANNHGDAVRHRTHTGCRRGEAHPSTKISYGVVCAIRATGGQPSCAAVAQQFGVSCGTVRNFVLGLERVDA